MLEQITLDKSSLALIISILFGLYTIYLRRKQIEIQKNQKAIEHSDCHITRKTGDDTIPITIGRRSNDGKIVWVRCENISEENNCKYFDKFCQVLEKDKEIYFNRYGNDDGFYSPRGVVRKISKQE